MSHVLHKLLQILLKFLLWLVIHTLKNLKQKTFFYLYRYLHFCCSSVILFFFFLQVNVYLESHRGRRSEPAWCMDSGNNLQKQKNVTWSLGERKQRYVPWGKKGNGKARVRSRDGESLLFLHSWCFWYPSIISFQPEEIIIIIIIIIYFF